MKCKYCGSLILFAQSHCNQCGAPLSDKLDRSAKKQTKEDVEVYENNTLAIIFAVLGLSFVVAFACFSGLITEILLLFGF